MTKPPAPCSTFAWPWAKAVLQWLVVLIAVITCRYYGELGAAVMASHAKAGGTA